MKVSSDSYSSERLFSLIIQSACITGMNSKKRPELIQ